jgi:glycosyltransferase domain-containing protein
MKIHDADLFALIVPTFQGTPFLKRTLDYFRHVGFRGQVVLSDNSTHGHRDFVCECVQRYPDLRIDIHLFPAEIRFLDKMVATCERIGAPFVMLHAHDDFLVPDAVEQCVGVLADRADYSVARGRVAMFALSRGSGEHAGKIGMSRVPHPMRGYEQDDSVERVIKHIERYASTFYSVHRREQLMESFRITEAATKNVIFFQYLSSCISALNGKIWCSDELFYVRQGHEDSWSGSLRKGNYEAWPMLITSSDFSRYYQEFRGTLVDLVTQQCGASSSEIAERIDRAAVSLFQRSYCGKELDNPEEARFARELADESSKQNKLLSSIVQFTAQYGDTF